MRDYQNPFPDADPLASHFRTLKSDAQALVVEIGCGVGLHPIQFAQKNPDTFIIAIEKTADKFDKFQRRFEHHNLPNLLPVHANVQHWVPQHLQANEVDAYYMLYPNPYPKESQKNKRFMNMPFMACVIKTLKPGGQITLATNELFYYEEAKAVFVDTWGLDCIEDRIIAADEPPRTHFEKKYLSRGARCYNLVFVHR